LTALFLFYEQFDEAMAISRNNIPILQKLIY